MSPECPPCQLVTEDAPLSGAENMQRDEALLQRVIDNPAHSHARIYTWDQPTVSLGYFQPLDSDVDSRIADCPRVRRVTGGGAILHDDEITYCCAVPASHPVRHTPTDLYEIVHNAIVRLLQDCGVQATMRMHAAGGAEAASKDEPFLCFLRSDPRDIVCRGYKITGSAQRRRKGNILQHGSILLRHSHLTPDVPGLLDLNELFNLPRFRSEIGPAIREALMSYGTDSAPM